jgi:hypothetical protein
LTASQSLRNRENLPGTDDISGNSISAAECAQADSVLAGNATEIITFFYGIFDYLRLRLGLCGRRLRFRLCLGDRRAWRGDTLCRTRLRYSDLGRSRLDWSIREVRATHGSRRAIPFFGTIRPCLNVIPPTIEGPGHGVGHRRGLHSALSEERKKTQRHHYPSAI